MPDYVHFRDLAQLGVNYTRQSLNALIARRAFPACEKLCNGHIRWRKADIVAWLAARKAA